MRLRWLLIGCLIGPASANSDLWIHRSDLSSQLLAQAYLEPLSEAVGEELTIKLADSQAQLAQEVTRGPALGWGALSAGSTGLYDLTLALVSRQDVPFSQPEGRVGIPDVRWAQNLKTLHPDAQWISIASIEQGLRWVASGEIDAVAATQSGLSLALSQTQIAGMTLNPLNVQAPHGLFSGPGYPKSAELATTASLIQPGILRTLAEHQLRPEPAPEALLPWGLAAAMALLWVGTLVMRRTAKPTGPATGPTFARHAPTKPDNEEDERAQAYLREVNQRLQDEIEARHAKEAELLTVQQALGQAQRRLEQQVRTDALTGLANRRHFDETLANEWRRHAREQSPMTLVLMDIDYFKKYNDALGHPAGDDCLRRVAGLLTEAFGRSADLAARYGGEEFVVLLANTAVDEAAEQVERLQGLIANASVMHPASDISPQITLSMGIASCIPIRDEDPWNLVEAADQGLYEAKKLGRNRYQVRAA